MQSKFLRVGNCVPDIVWQTAVGVGDISRTLKNNDFERISNEVYDFSLLSKTPLEKIFSNLKNNGADIFRFEVYLTRQKFNLYSNFKERSSADCKFLQSTLRYEFGFDNLPTNMMPVAQLEAIVGCLLCEEKLNNNTHNIFDFRGLEVVNLK